MLLSVRRERLSSSDWPCLAAVARSLTETDVASLKNISGSLLPRLNFHRPQEELSERDGRFSQFRRISSLQRGNRKWFLVKERLSRSKEGRDK